jgi:hypothetical protein
MVSNIIEAEVSVTKKWPPRSGYFAFNCRELITDENKYGRISAPDKLYGKIQENGTYRIAYHMEGKYLNLDTLITDVAKDPPPRPATNPKDAFRMGAHGGYNAALSSIEGMTFSDWLQVDPKQLANLLLRFYQAEDIADKRLKETLRDNPADIHTGRRKQESEELDDGIPFFPKEK